MWAPSAIPGGWRERISTSLPANAQSDRPRDHSANTIKTEIIIVDFYHVYKYDGKLNYNELSEIEMRI